MFFGEQDGTVFVNSAAGNRAAEPAFFALGADVRTDGAVQKEVLLGRVVIEAGECPPSKETVFGAVAVRRYVAARLAALTRHEYTQQGVGRIVRGWDFIGHAAGLHFSCARSLDTAVGSHLAARVERWKANLSIRASSTRSEE